MTKPIPKASRDWWRIAHKHAKKALDYTKKAGFYISKAKKESKLRERAESIHKKKFAIR